MLCFLSSVTNSATQIMLEEGYEIRFDGGKIDTETFNMQITNVEVFKNDKPVSGKSFDVNGNLTPFDEGC